MNKIGILTFHKSINYGSVLQAFALQQAVNGLGFSTEIIDYEPHHYDYTYALFRPVKSVSDIKHDVANLMYMRVIMKKKREFAMFRRDYLTTSKQMYRSGEDFQAVCEEYSAVLCGSDQIWNRNADDSDVNFFLPFSCHGRKVSYAVSLNGGNFRETQDSDNFRSYLNDFDSISVREADAQKELEAFLGRKVYLSLDPTFLLLSSKIEELSSRKIVQEPYIFFYSIRYNKASVKAACELAELKNEKVFVLHTGKGVGRALKNGNSIQLMKDNVSPCDFLSLIRYADYVITDSFHGTAFSIILKKKFYSIIPVTESGEETCDPRIYNILKLLSLERRYVSGKDVKTIDIDEPIDYEAVDCQLSVLRNESMDYLKKALS